MGSQSKLKESLIYPLEYYNDLDAWVKQVSTCLKQLGLGRIENTGSFTLSANANITTVYVAYGLIGMDSKIFFTPVTANAAAEIGGGTMYLFSRDPTVESGGRKYATFTVRHANNAQTNREFLYAILG